jgi:hypothetical protein
VPLLIIIGSIVGVVLQFGLSFLLLRRAFHTLQDLTTIERKTHKKRGEEKEIKIEVKIVKPVMAYLKRDLAIITRETQAIMLMLWPVMIPVSTALGFQIPGSIANTGIPWLVLYMMAFAILSSFLVIFGVTTIESGGNTITSALLINTRDQIKAKIPLLYSVVPIMVLLSLPILINKETFLTIVKMITTLLPAVLIITLAGFFFKLYLFGKLKYKFVLEEVNKELMVLKYLGIILLMFGIGAGFLFSLAIGYWFTLVIEGICLISLFLIFNLMFSKNRLGSTTLNI